MNIASVFVQQQPADRTLIVLGLIAALPATVTAFAAWRQARRTHREVQTNHGHRSGEYVEMIPLLLAMLTTHTTNDSHNFMAIAEKLGVDPSTLRSDQDLLDAVRTITDPYLKELGKH